MGSYRPPAYGHGESEGVLRRHLRRQRLSLLSLAEAVRTEVSLLSSSSSHRALRLRGGKNWGRNFLPWPPVLEVLIFMLWVHILNWGERSVFSSHVSQCGWKSWESWPADATPYRLALVADPQLVDPHTYPGRPWPLSTFTIKHTDQYLRRSFESVLDNLDPSSVLFLGDLFDGGREWSTDHGSVSPEKRWNKYGEDFWLNEYDRFARIFVDPWAKATKTADLNVERRFRANLPGNHDLGISNGVQLQVRERFATYFGEVNTMEVLGNHTVVMVDTVSLTAKTAQGDGNPVNHEIWQPADDFLQQAKDQRKIVAERELRSRKGVRVSELLKHEALERPNLGGPSRPAAELGGAADFPALLLTHVPLYRAPGTPCGPQREKHPPTKTSSGEALESDEPNALKVHGGYQYQNVLHPEISEQIINSLGVSSVAHVFSGDDHDYCEVLHRGFTAPGGGIREITVKSMSWAMGVRHPGFLLVSLWNPIDSDGTSLSHEPTVQTHLCLLPDQLGIFIHYGKMLVLTFALLLAGAGFAAIRYVPGNKGRRASVGLLPLRNPKATARDDEEFVDVEDLASSSSSAHSADGGLSSRARKGNASVTGFERDADRAGYAFPGSKEPGAAVVGRPPSRQRFFFVHMWKSVRLVGLCGLGYYFWLARTV